MNYYIDLSDTKRFCKSRLEGPPGPPAGMTKQTKNKESLKKLEKMNEDLSQCELGGTLKVEEITDLARWSYCPMGTMVFVERDQVLLVKVHKGWQYVLVSGSRKQIFEWIMKCLPFSSGVSSTCQRLHCRRKQTSYHEH